jgi:hypothetical protein
MMEDRILTQVTDLRETMDILIKGLMNMLKIQAQQSAVLKEILAACTAEPEGPSPLVNLILKLDGAIESQTEAIARIEQAIVRAD